MKDEMKTMARLATGLVIVGMAIALFGVGFPAIAEEDDPVVSLSYLNQRLKPLEEGKSRPPLEAVSSGITVVELEKGQKIIGAAGTEIILRSGKAKAVGGEKGGLSDVTDGKDLSHGQSVALNHQLILPRSDGRGIVAQSRCFVMVRGSHAVE